jgi:PAS domain-containing protein
LSVVGPPPEPHTWFCTCCGCNAAEEEPDPFERVCPKCGVGLLLETVSAMAPASTDAFLVVDNGFEVAAISQRAEELLGVHERSVVRRPVAALLVPAEQEPRGACALLAAVADTTSGTAGVRPSHLQLRTIQHGGVQLHARIGRCGPPIGALIVLEPTAAERAKLLGRG